MTGAPRSVLYIPASRRPFLGKLGKLGADLVIVDLEDGVSPADKDAARENVRQAVGSGALSAERSFMLRVNGGPAGPPAEDLTLVGFAKPAWVVLPKAEDPGLVRSLAARFAEHGADTALMIETAAGVGAAAAMAGSHAAVRMLILGSADLRLSLGSRPDKKRRWERHALAEVLLAARCHGCAAIDSVYFRYQDEPGLRAHARIARDLGYDGKSCIHPAQIPPIHDVYRSGRDEVAWARRVLAAWSAEDGARRGVVAVNGEMIEALHVTVAERILARAPRKGKR